MTNPRQTKKPIRNFYKRDPNKPIVLSEAQKEEILKEVSELIDSGFYDEIYSMTPEEIKENTIGSVNFWGAQSSVLYFDKDKNLESINGATITEKTRKLLTYKHIDKEKGEGAKITINEDVEGNLYLNNFFDCIECKDNNEI